MSRFGTVAKTGLTLGAAAGVYWGAGQAGEFIAGQASDNHADTGANLRICADLVEFSPEAADLIFVPSSDGTTQVAVGIEMHESAAADQSACDPDLFADQLAALPDNLRTGTGEIAFAAAHEQQVGRDIESETPENLQKAALGAMAAVVAWRKRGWITGMPGRIADRHRTRAAERAARAEERANQNDNNNGPDDADPTQDWSDTPC